MSCFLLESYNFQCNYQMRRSGVILTSCYFASILLSLIFIVLAVIILLKCCLLQFFPLSFYQSEVLNINMEKGSGTPPVLPV